ncbi:hypothetical protein [Clostridium akagii]|uniref:hypothetical protein n=1 Tax=Clostridium akagii TaxID=91623 RepID=UPI00047BD444|nr:hypothetical protein [Clostridium akagii]
MKNGINKIDPPDESETLAENIDTVDPSLMYSMSYIDSTLMQRKKSGSHHHPTTPYKNHGEYHTQFYPIERPYGYYQNYSPYYNFPYEYFIPFMPFGYQLDEYDEY